MLTKETVENIKSKFLDLLNSKSYNQWQDSKGVLYELTDEDKLEIKADALRLFKVFPIAYIAAEIEAFSFVDKFIEHPIVKEVEDIVVSRVINIILSTSRSEEVQINSEDKIKIPVFSFPHRIRLKAASILRKKNNMWGLKIVKKSNLFLKQC